MCAPTRQQLYTGVWPVRSGAYPNHSKVYEGTRSWVHHFETLGYRCGLAGKNHCNPKDSYPWEVVVPSKGDLKMDQIAEFLTRDSDQPYFLVVAHHDPHTPWNHGDASEYPPDSIEVPPYLVDTPETRDALSRYYAEITYMDSELGQVTQMVDESGQRDDTIVVFTSEQGSAFPFGGKWTCYENGLRTSFVVRWPERVQAGTHASAMCQYIDVVPTLLDAVGVDPASIDTGLRGAAEGGNGFDGQSFLPVLLGNSDRLRDYTFGVIPRGGSSTGPTIRSAVFGESVTSSFATSTMRRSSPTRPPRTNRTSVRSSGVGSPLATRGRTGRWHIITVRRSNCTTSPPIPLS